jgi:microcompartment protein CcmL/EutN
LVAFEGSVRPAELGVNLQLTRDGVRVDGDEVEDGTALRQHLDELVAETIRIAGRSDGTIKFSGRMLLSVHGDVPAVRVVEEAAVAFQAGFSTLISTVRLPAQPGPLYLEPELAQEILAELPPPSEHEQRQSQLGERLSEEAGACEAAVEVFRSVAAAAVEQKRPLFSEGIGTIQSKCREKTWRRVITLLQLHQSPEVLGFPMGALEATWVADGERVEVAPDTPWSGVVTKLAALGDRKITLVVENPAGDAAP